MKQIKPISRDEKGRLVINLAADEANSDWIRAGRLKEKAEAGDEQAQAKLEQMENTPMYRDK